MTWHAALVMVPAMALGLGAQGASFESVLERARIYVESLDGTLSPLVADELYVQTGDIDKVLGGSALGVTGQGGSGMVETSTARVTRRIASELLMVRTDKLPTGWAGLRDVLQVDAKTMRAKDGRLDGLAAQQPTDLMLARQLATFTLEANTHKVGPAREFCVPTAALGLLRRSVTGLKFEKAGEERVAGSPAWKIGFSGTAAGAIVGRPGGDASLRGTFWVDPTDGRVLRSRVDYGDRLDPYQFRVEVSYARDAALGVLVPTEMRERFEGPGAKVDGKATYTKFRRPAAPER